MSCSNDCNQGRKCNCQETQMNQFDERHTKFLRTDPYKHTEFEEEELGNLNLSVVFVVAVVVVSCILYLI
jgi:hypothetical protein